MVSQLYDKIARSQVKKIASARLGERSHVNKIAWGWVRYIRLPQEEPGK